MIFTWIRDRETSESGISEGGSVGMRGEAESKPGPKATVTVIISMKSAYN